MNTYLEWLEFCEDQRAKSLVPAVGATKPAHEVDKAYWKGYMDAARDAARYIKPA